MDKFTMAVPSHPYYPPEAVIHDFSPKKISTATIFGIFVLTGIAVLLPTYSAIRRIRPTISRADLSTALWFVLCSCIHLGLEGYYVVNVNRMGSHDGIVTQMWKEYAMSDSRYLTLDGFVFCMEVITAACWGPLSVMCAYCIVHDSPWRHPLQTIISLGQLYGDVLYLATCTFDEFVYQQSYSRPERYYYWGYYIFMNSFWIVIPAILLVNSAMATSKAFAKVKSSEKIAVGK